MHKCRSGEQRPARVATETPSGPLPGSLPGSLPGFLARASGHASFWIRSNGGRLGRDKRSDTPERTYRMNGVKLDWKT